MMGQLRCTVDNSQLTHDVRDKDLPRRTEAVGQKEYIMVEDLYNW